MKKESSQKSRTSASGQDSRRSGSARNMPRQQTTSQDETKHRFGQSNKMTTKTSPGRSQIQDQTFGTVLTSQSQTMNTTLKHTQLIGNILEAKDSRLQSNHPRNSSTLTEEQSQRTMKVEEKPNIINRNRSNFSFASGAKPVNLSINKDVVPNSQTENSADHYSNASPLVLQASSANPTPNTFKQNQSVQMSGGNVVRVPDSASDSTYEYGMHMFGQQPQTSNFQATQSRQQQSTASSAKTVPSLAKNNQKSVMTDHNAYMPVQQKEPNLNLNKSNLNHDYTSKGGRNDSQLEISQMTRQSNDAIAARVIHLNQQRAQTQANTNDGQQRPFITAQYSSQSKLNIEWTDESDRRSQRYGDTQQMQQFYQMLGYVPQHTLDPNETRSQVEQLRHYRRLCEQRILQLAPDHPLPVLEQHLTQSLREMQMQVKSSRSMSSGSRDDYQSVVDQLQSDLQTAQRDKSLLERALREETLANEEQRNYIQILKQVIEQKLERDGILDLLRQSIQAKNGTDYNTFGQHQSRSEDNPINLYVLLSDLKLKFEQKARENLRLSDVIKTLESQHLKFQQDLSQSVIKVSNLQKQVAFYEEQANYLQAQQADTLNKNEELISVVEAQSLQIENLKQEMHDWFVQKNGGVDPENNSMQFQKILANQMRQDQSSSYSIRNNSPQALLKNNVNISPEPVRQERFVSLHNCATHYLDGSAIEPAWRGTKQFVTDDLNGHNRSQNNGSTLSNASAGIKGSLMNEIDALSKELREVQKTCVISKEKISQFQQEADQQQVVIASLQDRLTQKDTDIRSLRESYEERSNEIFQLNQVIDSLQFNNAQLEKRLEMHAVSMKKKDHERSRLFEEAQTSMIEETRHYDELQNTYEKNIKAVQRELKQAKETYHSLEIDMEARNQEVERLASELELKTAQLDASKRQGAREKQEIKDLRNELDETKFNIQELQKEKLRRDEKIQFDAASREQLMREKAELALQNNELLHQLDVIMTQTQTSSIKNEQQVREALVKADTLERMQKQKTTETEVLTKELAQTACKFKQTEAQVMYLEKSNQQLLVDLRQAKIENDQIEREKIKLAAQVSDLVEENEQLYRNEERARRINEDLQNARAQQKSTESEIVDLDRKLRGAFELKEGQDIEINRLKREVQSLEQEKSTLIKQKETLSCQTRDAERRIFDYVKGSQESEDKLRKNAAFIKDLVSERDKFRDLIADKEREIGDIALELKTTRGKLTDLTLIEEKTERFIEDSDVLINANKKSLHDFLRGFLRTVANSDALCQMITMRKRERGHEIQEIMNKRKECDDIWGQMINFKETQTLIGDAITFLTDMIEIFVQNYVELNVDFNKREKQVNQLETKLSNIHTVDLRNQDAVLTMKQELTDLRKQFADMETEKDKDIMILQETVKLVQTKNLELAKTQTITEKKLHEQLADIPIKQKKHEEELLNQNRLLQTEKQKLQDLLQKVSSFLRGSQAETLIEQMGTCALAIAKAQNDKALLSSDLQKLEVKLNKAVYESGMPSLGAERTLKPSTVSSPTQLGIYYGTQQLSCKQFSPPTEQAEGHNTRHLRQAVQQQDNKIAEVDDRIAFLQGKLNMLENQLHELRNSDVDIFPNRENPFRETRETEQRTHSLQVLLKETKDLRQKLNDKNSIICSLEAELRKVRTQTLQFTQMKDFKPYGQVEGESSCSEFDIQQQ